MNSYDQKDFMSLEEYNCPEKVINIEEIQKIENIFRNAHLNTKSKIKITHTSVENRTYPHINYDLIIDKKIHINLYASKKTYVSEDKRIESRLTVTSSVYVEKSSNKKLHLNEYNQSFWELSEFDLYLDYKSYSYLGFFGRTSKRRIEWTKETDSKFDKKGKKFLKDTFSKIEKLKKTVKFGNLKK